MIVFRRVSTEEQAKSGLGLETQHDSIQRYADAYGWDLVCYEDAGLSAKPIDRPQLRAATARPQIPAKNRDVDGIVVAKLDRLSRSVHDFSGLLRLTNTRKWSVVAIDLGVDTSPPTGRFVANITMAVAAWEREAIGARTSAAMHAAKRPGRHMGRVSVPPGATRDRLMTLRATHTLAATAMQLNAEGLATATDGTWTANAVGKVHARLTATASLAGDLGCPRPSDRLRRQGSTPRRARPAGQSPMQPRW